MKQMPLLSATLIVVMAVSVTSCKPSRVWATKDKRDREEKVERSYDPPPPPAPPRYYSSIRLVISPTPGFVMNRYPDGRYYHRTPQGLLYWKGYDNRFFLDRSYLGRVNYSRWEYDEWKQYNRSNSRRRY